MALTKVGKEGVVGLDNSADATAITISSGEVVTLSNNLITNGNVLRGANDSSNTLSGGTASNSGGNIGVYGSSHSSLASNIRFRSGSTVTMLMDSTGAMTKPLQPAFLATIAFFLAEVFCFTVLVFFLTDDLDLTTELHPLLVFPHGLAALF